MKRWEVRMKNERRARRKNEEWKEGKLGWRSKSWKGK